MRILFLSAWYPFPANNGSKLRIYNLLHGLAEYHEIVLISFGDLAPDNRAEDELDSICHAVYVVPKRTFYPNHWPARLAIFNPKPRSVVDTYSPEMATCIKSAMSRGDIDLVIVSQSIMVAYCHLLGNVATLLEELELTVLWEQYITASSWNKRFRYGLTWVKHRYYIQNLLPKFMTVTVVSEQEKLLASRLVKPATSLEVVPNCVTVSHYVRQRSAPQKNSLIFTGSFSYQPNYEAMYWFLEKVFPVVLTQMPDVCLTITGDHLQLPLPTTKNVKLTGYVKDIKPLVSSSWAAVVPLWRGGGTRLKILEAMAMKTPIIATSKGAEGLQILPNRHFLLADTAEDFAIAVIRILQDPALRQELSENAYQQVCENYDWEKNMPRFLQIVENAVNIR